MTIAFLGTGLLGSGFVEAATRRGERVTVWNRTIEKARALEAFGARVATTPADAVRDAARVHLVLRDDDSVDEVIAALRPALEPGTVIVDHTTTQPARTAERSARLIAEDVNYLHCPVFIGPPAARQSKGTILSSGPRALFDTVQPALATMAEQVVYLGERPDLAAVHKLCGNALIIGLNAVVSDALTVAAGAGVAATDALTVVDHFSLETIVRVRGRKMSKADYVPTFELAMARKDVRLMMETAGTLPLSALPAIAARMDTLIADGRGADDLAVLARDAV